MRNKQITREAAHYAKHVEWSDEDQCFVGRWPDLMLGGVHGKDETKVYAELCAAAKEMVELIHNDGQRMPPPEGKGGFGLAVLLACLFAAAASAVDNPPPVTGTAVFTMTELRALAGTNGFKPYAGNPVLAPGAKGTWDAGALGSMTVLKVKDVFHMYYEAWGVRSTKADSWQDYNTLQIGHATSADGVHWVKDPANPVVPRGQQADAFDYNGTWDPFVLYEGGQFKMWYGGGNPVDDWAYAVSADGTHFTKKGRISRLGNVEDDHVIHDPGTGRYYMYYWDRAHEPMGLYRASAASETGFDFGKAQVLKIEGEQYPGMYKFTHVFRDGGAWYMLYGNFVRPHCPNGTVRLATSPDGLKWTSVNQNLVEGHDGEMLQAAPGLYLLYYGPRNHFDAAGCDIRVALYHGKLKSLAGLGAPTDTDSPRR